MNMPEDSAVRLRERLSVSSFAVGMPGFAVPVIIALVIGLGLGARATSLGLLIAGLLGVAIIVALRHDIFTATFIIALSLLEDWYGIVALPVTFPVISIMVALVLLVIIFFGQSEERPWISVPNLWVWALCVLVASLHLTQGVSLNESIKYDAQVFVNAAVMWTLGVQLVRNSSDLRRLVILLAGFGTLIAIHSIIISLTGIFLFQTSDALAHLSSALSFRITGTNINRAGSFIGSPDWNGTWMAMLAFLPLGLILSESSRWKQVVFAGEFLLVLIALLVTYSTAAWLALGAGVAVFILLAVKGRQRLYVLGGVLGAPLVVGAIFQRQAQALILHVTASGQLSLRLGAWTTALKIIGAYPLTGFGLGWSTYLERAAPYRVKAQIIPLGHPHDAYLEIAAMAGIPMLLLFITLLILAGRAIAQTYAHAAPQHRAIVSAIIAALIALTVNSIAINGWTLQPLAALGWLLAGALASPALAQSLSKSKQMSQEHNPTAEHVEMWRAVPVPSDTGSRS